jgi:hypothetical protein
MTTQGPREITTPFRPIPLDIPKNLSKNEFFNSPENIDNLVNSNGLLTNPENLVLYRKAIPHSNLFDCSIIYNTSKSILNPLGRPVRRTQLPEHIKHTWNRMNQIIISYMLKKYPNPEQHLVLAGEASLDPTWPLTSPGVPSIRMLHNHFMVFDKSELSNSPLADDKNPNLTDGGQHSLFASHVQDAYLEFLTSIHLKMLKPVPSSSSSLGITGYPQGLPSWEIIGGINTLKNIDFWNEYDKVLTAFLDFYRTFFNHVSSRNAGVPKNAYFPNEIEHTLLFNNKFLSAAKKVRDKCISNPEYASKIRWQPAFKQLIYRNDEGKLIVTISQNSIGNAITELLGIVVKRTPNTEKYEEYEPELIKQLLELRSILATADLGTKIDTECW